MKRIAILFCALMVLVSVVCNSRTGGHGGPPRQSSLITQLRWTRPLSSNCRGGPPWPPVQTTPSQWKRYTAKNEQFSVALPGVPIMHFGRMRADFAGNLPEITFGMFADGVLYSIYVLENRSPRQSLDSFIKGWPPRSSLASKRKTERKLTVDGVDGKTFSFVGMDGAVQFFSTRDRLYQFAAFGAPPDDARLTTFFSSISFVNKTDAIQVSEKPPFVHASDDASEKIFTPKEVDKTFKVVLNFHPDYTELARQNQVTGTIILECVLNANGTITRIRVVSGLPFGLTERAIAAARGLKFIPAMKDGKYVSISTRLVYKFGLF